MGTSSVIDVALWIGTSDRSIWVATTGDQIAVSLWISAIHRRGERRNLGSRRLPGRIGQLLSGGDHGLQRRHGVERRRSHAVRRDYLNSRVLMLDPVTGASQGANDGVSTASQRSASVALRMRSPIAHSDPR